MAAGPRRRYGYSWCVIDLETGAGWIFPFPNAASAIGRILCGRIVNYLSLSWR